VVSLYSEGLVGRAVWYWLVDSCRCLAWKARLVMSRRVASLVAEQKTKEELETTEDVGDDNEDASFQLQGKPLSGFCLGCQG